jgi:tRNA(Ile)-lysidine synthase
MSLVELASESIRRYAMLRGGELVLVAVSGGADSVALLHVLHTLAPSWRLRLHVAHVDHRLRPDSSRDAEFVRELARRLSVPVDVLPVDVSHGGSPEAAARTARYAALETLAARIGADRIAVAHTADDQAETVLMRLLEGAGPRGLAGIPPVRGQIIRPLIGARRADLIAALEGAGLPWMEDPSNRDVRFLRNRIRHEVLPRLAQDHPDLVRALNRTARLARSTIESVEHVARLELGRVGVFERDAVMLPARHLAALPREIAAEVLRQAVVWMNGPVALRRSAQRRLRRVLVDPPPRPWRLAGVAIDVSAGSICVARASARICGVATRPLAVPGLTELPELEIAIRASLAPARDPVPRGRDTVAFDADVICGPFTIRSRRPGDRFTPFRGHERRLKTFLINEKIPRWRRDAVPIVEAGGRIAWLAGIRRGDVAPVTAHTRRVLELALVSRAPVRSGSMPSPLGACPAPLAPSPADR